MVNVQKYTNSTCKHCGEKYHAKRSDSKFCSPACRVANHRKPNPKQEIDALCSQAGSIINELVKHMDNPENQKQAYEALDAVQGMASFWMSAYRLSWWRCVDCKTAWRGYREKCSCGSENLRPQGKLG